MSARDFKVQISIANFQEFSKIHGPVYFDHGWRHSPGFIFRSRQDFRQALMQPISYTLARPYTASRAFPLLPSDLYLG